MKALTHRELSEDLAIAKGTIYVEAPLGSVWAGQLRAEEARIDRIRNGDNPEKEWGSVQLADVVVVRPSYTRFCVDIFEVKRSRADFLSDIRSGKWRGYLNHCHRFYFACDSGVAKKEDVPVEAGLIVRGEKGWSTLKAAAARDIEIPEETLLSFIFFRNRWSLSQRHRFRVRHDYYDKEIGKLKKVGKKVAAALHHCHRCGQLTNEEKLILRY